MAGDRPPEPDDLLAALPPPAAWGELAKAIAARPAPKTDGDLGEAGLRLQGATLTGDKRRTEPGNQQYLADKASV